MPLTPPAPELFGLPTATWALFVSLLSFGIAMVALGWQVTKHFLDGGRVKVYLNVAVLEPEFMVATMRTGRFSFTEEHGVASVTRGRALELAQLVVENPGRVPVTIYSPGLAISGHGKRRHTLTPRMFETEDTFGPDRAVMDSVVRLESYGRVTFLLDYWSVIPRLLEEAPKKQLALRGFVSVAGRTKRPQKSSWRRRWRIKHGDYTAIPDSPKFTPFAVIWRELYIRLPEREDESRHPESGRPITRGMVHFLLHEAMGKFDTRPELELLQRELDLAALKHGDKYPVIGSSLFEAYQALDAMAGHLTGWSEGLLPRRSGGRVANATYAAPSPDSPAHSQDD
ncbi:hypothetical protein [Frigoribacterium faeni]|uniref:Uncharacterized protein n=1 Tax=Frigoribacterium faeni TaxID=145483 RepID=A0A7W3JFR9_9MICO|nr:hypothetical protein [Frigoribacterium faeni]MBA8811988.1 hypothetical protein [Frigoribacterium faeni]BFF12988.1 hypothetical protein GCM10025699_42910 [Microbacterium flavescens]GEK83963.1 hypothetical protein FFA01_22720 [Frigoribacterium faeni]